MGYSLAFPIGHHCPSSESSAMTTVSDAPGARPTEGPQPQESPLPGHGEVGADGSSALAPLSL